MTFADLRLAEPLLRAVAAEGYTIPTPVQMQAIPHVLAGRDLLGCAQTGTGKTAAFALPILHRLGHNDAHEPRRIRTLVLTPTRELAIQIHASFQTYGRHTGMRQTVIFGGVSQFHQVRALRDGVEILVATPGRLLDLMNQRLVDLRAVEMFVLDEADRMLDMGFINDIRKVVAHLPAKRQTLLFSATMPTEIRKLAGALLKDPVEVQVASVSAAADTVRQSVYFVTANAEKVALLRQLLHNNGMSRTLVFTRTKRGADKVVKHLRTAGLHAEAIHSNKNQNARQRALASFKSNRPPVLVATDIASRGIDIDEISHVINYDIPRESETYVHRIGRTGRAGASGTALSFCGPEERDSLRAIERLIRQRIPVQDTPPSALAQAKPAHAVQAHTHSSPAHQSHRQPKPAHAVQAHTQTVAAHQSHHQPKRAHAVQAHTHSSPAHQPHHQPKPAHAVHAQEQTVAAHTSHRQDRHAAAPRPGRTAGGRPKFRHSTTGRPRRRRF
jgi:ATP-dependent RNA helicase RhlE